MRTLLTPVWVRIEEFPSTRTMVYGFSQAPEQLNRAHEAGAVQQDIKAGNVLLIENCLEPERLVGFVIDCDYAALSEEALRVLRDVVKPRPHRHFFPDQDKANEGQHGYPLFHGISDASEKSDRKARAGSRSRVAVLAAHLALLATHGTSAWSSALLWVIQYRVSISHEVIIPLPRGRLRPKWLPFVVVDK
ncbi:unnamed protein product [Mycena citricolor]|uniref:Fungal-type protein kinase domain-containing protein n=1 Tax=Mycena citricolor TaxID=2018698 RepID=A0AAD2Q5I2_9AGAR|nr:unnamed protein product [Mycena citricolor]